MGIFVACIIIGIGLFRAFDYLQIFGPTDEYSMQRNTRGMAVASDTLTVADLQVTNELAKAWLYANQSENGLLVYQADAKSSGRQNKNNELRQLLASRQLALDSVLANDRRVMHRKNLDFIMRYWYQQRRDESGNTTNPIDGHGIVVYNGKSKLGANALLLRLLVASPYYQEYASRAQAVAEGILSLQNADGSFSPWYQKPSYSYNTERLLNFYSGEALLALLEYYDKLQAMSNTNGDGQSGSRYLEAAMRSSEYYLDRYVNKITNNYYPAYVPWHTMAYARLYQLTQNEKYANAVFILNDKLLELQDTSAFIGRFYNPATPQYGSPHASSDAVYLEGLAYAYEVAGLYGDIMRANRYRDAINLGVRNLMSLQCLRADRMWHGAICIRADDTLIRTRVDATQHTVDAFTKIIALFRPGECIGTIPVSVRRSAGNGNGEIGHVAGSDDVDIDDRE